MTTNRDALIRAALAPSADLVVPTDLGDRINEGVRVTPQRGLGLQRWMGPLRRFVPELTPMPRAAAVVLTALLLLALAIVTVIGIASQRDPTFPSAVTAYHGGPTQDGVMPGPAPDGIATILLEAEMAGPMNNLSAPLVRDGIVFLADLRGNVEARRADDLTSVWATRDLPDGVEAPVLLGPTLVIAGRDGTVVGLDAASGTIRWTRSLDVTIESPLAGIDERVIVGSSDGVVAVLSAVDGAVVHRVDAGGPVKRSPPVADGIAYVVSDTGMVTAFDVATGGTTWVLDLARDDVEALAAPEVSTPAFADGILYVARGPNDASVPHEVVAVDVGTQEIRWRSTAPSTGRLFVGAITDDDVITIGEADGVIRRFDRATGESDVLYQNAAAMGALPTVVDDTLFVSSYDGMVRAIDLASGAERWHVQLDGQPTMPVVVDGRIHVGTSLGEVVIIGT